MTEKYTKEDSNRSRAWRVIAAAGLVGAAAAATVGIGSASGPAECNPNIDDCTVVDGTAPTLPQKGEETTVPSTEAPTTSTSTSVPESTTSSTTTTTEAPGSTTTTAEAPTTSTTIPGVPTTVQPQPPVVEIPPATVAIPVAPHTM